MRRLALGLVVLGVGCRDREPAAAPPVQPIVHVTPDARDGWDQSPPDAAPKPPSVCTQLDYQRVGIEIGVTTPLVQVSGYHLGGPAWGSPGLRVCDWLEVAHGFSGLGLTVGLDAELALDIHPSPGLSAEPDPDPITWRDLSGLGKPAAVGHSQFVAFLQVLSNHVRVEVGVYSKELTRAERERRVIVATKAVLAQLPADATPWIANPPAPPSPRN